MYSARSTMDDHPEAADHEPVVLSYTQFRNQLGLLEWRRRLARYEQDVALSAALRPQHTAAPAAGRLGVRPTRCGLPLAERESRRP